MTVWFSSDLHLGHRAMAWMREVGHWPTQEERPLVTAQMVQAHDDLLASKWDAVVGKDDVVWVLGDLIANPKSLDAALHWIMLRPGHKHLILGNHDPAHPMSRDSHKWLWRYNDAFTSVQLAARRRIGGQEVLLNHFPYTGDGDGKEDRCSQWRLRNEGLPLLHGHVHTTDKVTWAPPPGCERDMDPSVAEHFTERVRQIHVGVDAWDLAPVSLEQIGELL